jgi:Beta-propeller repeat
MTTHSRNGRPYSRARMAAIGLAAAMVPALITVPLVRADPPAPSPDVAPPAQTANMGGRAGTLAFSSYLGGQEWDEATGVATDHEGNTVVAGFTLSEDFPVRGSGARGHAAIVDAFVTKVDPDDGRIVWSTQLGGVDMDAATAVTVDRDDNVYVVGRTGSPDFPTAGGLRHGLNGQSCTGEPCHDAFVTKLSSSGRIVWSTTFGGTRNEEALGVAVGQDRSVYVTGVTDSFNLPVKSAFQDTFQSRCPADLPCPYDGFVVKIAAAGDHLVYSTYLGGDAGDIARGIDVDRDGSAYVAGSTGSPDFPKVHPFQATMRGEHCGPPPGEPCRQAFLTKLSPNGSSAAYSTYLGGQEHDDAYGVAVDRDGRAHVTGSTQSKDFPTHNAIQATRDNSACTSEQPKELCDDAFVTKFGVSGQTLRYSTYLRGRAEDQGLNIDVTENGEALVAGRTDSTNFPVTQGAAQPKFGGYIDGFATKLDPNGKQLWGTFLGGKEADRATGISADRHGAAHVAGRTLSPNFPTVRPFQPALKDTDYDAFVSVINK